MGESSLWKFLGLQFPSTEEAGFGAGPSRTSLQPLQVVEAWAAEAEPRAGRSVSRGTSHKQKKRLDADVCVRVQGTAGPWLGGRQAAGRARPGESAWPLQVCGASLGPRLPAQPPSPASPGGGCGSEALGPDCPRADGAAIRQMS